MTPILISQILEVRMLHLVPLIVVVSLVYGATRHERMPMIAQYAFRGSIWLTLFLVIIWATIFVAGWGV